MIKIAYGLNSLQSTGKVNVKPSLSSLEHRIVGVNAEIGEEDWESLEEYGRDFNIIGEQGFDSFTVARYCVDRFFSIMGYEDIEFNDFKTNSHQIKSIHNGRGALISRNNGENAGMIDGVVKAKSGIYLFDVTAGRYPVKPSRDRFEIVRFLFPGETIFNTLCLSKSAFFNMSSEERGESKLSKMLNCNDTDRCIVLDQHSRYFARIGSQLKERLLKSGIVPVNNYIFDSQFPKIFADTASQVGAWFNYAEETARVILINHFAKTKENYNILFDIASNNLDRLGEDQFSLELKKIIGSNDSVQSSRYYTKLICKTLENLPQNQQIDALKYCLMGLPEVPQKYDSLKGSVYGKRILPHSYLKGLSGRLTREFRGECLDVGKPFTIKEVRAVVEAYAREIASIDKTDPVNHYVINKLTFPGGYGTGKKH